MAIDLSKTTQITARVDEITTALSDPSVASDMKEYMRLSKELADLTPKAETIRRYEAAIAGMKEALDLLNGEDDPEIRLMANEEYDEYREEAERLEDEIKLILAPRDIRDERSVIMEIRAGAGGEEAALFASTLVKMYTAYAALRGFAVKTIDENKTELGGYKEIVMQIEGYGAYSRLKFESGVHRVQRVPVTESGGRIHTSTCTVAVLPEADAEDVVINPSDLKIDRYRASGAGGQHINKTDSAIRITHIPTGIVVQCQDERSQIKNKDKAMAVLQSRLWEMTRAREKDALDSDRRSQVGTGDRSERIRTYNYHQGRVTDHRIGLTLYKLEEILNGSLDEIIDALTVAAAADGLNNSGDEGDE
ncbi:MAG: peptide chain release factor 1 [Clostridiales bacterium]|nr:peptide chain release factor 1 [Clostridiales bacterium]